MNDLERDLREVFDDDALRVPTPATAPEGLRRSARRRQAVFGGAVGLAGLAIVAGIIAGATTLVSMGGGPEPAALGPKTTGTVDGITITYPQAWHLIDPDTARLNGSPTMGESTLPRIVLALAPTEAPETFGCPGSIDAGAAPLLMTIQEEPLALEGPAATPWPVELEPLAVDASESDCYQGWTFERAGWTASGRTFEARVGFAPEASDDERDAVTAAFASMTFEPGDPAPASVILKTGAIDGEEYELIASTGPEGLHLTLQGESFALGSSSVPASEDLRAISHVFGNGRDAVMLTFGAVPAAAVRVVGADLFGRESEVEIIDVPDRIDPEANAFLAIGDLLYFQAFDVDGEVVASDIPAEEIGTTLEEGTHFGYVRSVDVDGRSITFDLAYFLSGEEANAAYHAAGGTGPVPNDHFVVNDNANLRTLDLSPELRLRLLDWNHCCETFFDGDIALFAQAIDAQGDVADGDLIYRGQSQWWITVRDGVVTQIEEQYAP